MARWMKRADDATFELNLAPMLDIIVTVIPMLLISVCFIQVKMIETPVPAVVKDQQQPTPPGVSLQLKMNKSDGFNFSVNDKGHTSDNKVALKNGIFDLAALTAMAATVKRNYPGLFRLELAPSETVSVNEIIKVMDAVRRAPANTKFSFRDEKSGHDVQTDLMFPDVTFSNVVTE